MMLEQEREKRRERRKHDHDSYHHQTTHVPSQNSNSSTMETSKLQYIRNLILQYLSCKDPVLKEHMESAIITIFRYNERERQSIQLRKQEENGSENILYSSFTSLVSNFSSSTT